MRYLKVRSPNPMILVKQNIDVNSASLPPLESLPAEGHFNTLELLPDMPDVEFTFQGNDGVQKVALP